MAVCDKDLGDGRVCSEHAPVVDTRLTRDEFGHACRLRIVECPVHSIQLQMVANLGDTQKRYVVGRLPRRILPDVLG